MPPRFAERLSAEDRARLEVLQAGLKAHLRPEADDDPEVDPWQRVADLAQWYLSVSSEPGACDVTIDSDRCLYLLGEATANGYSPDPSAVRELQRRWLTSSAWPCFAGTDTPPLLRGG